MGVHPGPDIAISAAASLAGVPSDRVRPLLAELARAHLIDEHAPGRFAFHDLLRAYAGELARLREPDAERRAALLRVLDYYLHTARAADRWLYPYRDEITLTPPGPGVTPDHITDQAHAMTWFTAEHVALRAAVALAADAGFPVHAMRTAWCLVTFFDRQGYWHAQVATQRVALGAARRLADREGQADHHRGLGLAHLRLGRYPDADTHLRQALDLFADLGDRPGQARTHRDLAYLSWLQDRNQQALHHIEQALDVSHTAGHRAGSAYALNAHGWYHSLRGEHGRAIEFYRRACALFQEADDRVGQAVSWEGRGHALRHLGHHGQATVCYRRAFDLWREAGDRYHQADTTERLGDLHDAVGDSDAARGAWQRALTILDELGHPDADRLRAKVRHLDDRPDDRRPDDRRSDDRRSDDRRSDDRRPDDRRRGRRR
jgi:tetratricopeptide (TPR) repeat protein